MKPKNARKRPVPSYEEGELRDKSIEQLQDAEYKKSDLHRLIGKAVSRSAKEKRT